jgi:hypothetical protein
MRSFLRTNYGYAARVYGTCLFHIRDAYFSFQTSNIFKIDIYGVHIVYLSNIKTVKKKMHDDTQRAPTTLACVTGDAYA